MAPDSKPMNAATPKANSNPMPGTKNSLAWKASPVTPSGAIPRAIMSTMMTTKNSSATMTPKTLADTSIERTPNKATKSQADSEVNHHGRARPVNSKMRLDESK